MMSCKKQALTMSEIIVFVHLDVPHWRPIRPAIAAPIAVLPRPPLPPSPQSAVLCACMMHVHNTAIVLQERTGCAYPAGST